MTMAQVYEPPDKSLICAKCGLAFADANVGGWWIHSNCKPHVTALRAALDQQRVLLRRLDYHGFIQHTDTCDSHQGSEHCCTCGLAALLSGRGEEE